MSDYTPTLEDAKRTYAYIQGGLDHDEGYKPFYQVHEEAFDRMIAEVERAAAEKAWAEGARWAAVECGTILHEGQEFLAPGDNPYRLNEGEKQ